MAGYPLQPQGNSPPQIGWTGAETDSTAPAGGGGPGHSQSYPIRKAEELWAWMEATGNKAMDAVSEKAFRSYEARVDELGRRLFGAHTWSEIYTAAKLILGPNCHYFGMACGMAGELADMVGDLVGLLKMFVLAGMYEAGGSERPQSALSFASPLTLGLALEGRLLRSFLGKEMKEADEKVRALVDQLGKIMTDPIKFLGATWASTKKEYIDKWNRHWQLLKDGGLTSKFESGKLAGEVLAQVILTVLALVSGVGAAARGVELGVGAVRTVGTAGEQLAALSKEAPELLKIAQGLEEDNVARAGGVAREAEEGEQSSTGQTKSNVRAASTEEPAAVPNQFDALAQRRKALGLPPAGSAGDDATLARLQIGNKTYDGINRAYQNPKTPMTLDRVNAQTLTHAEADAVQQAVNDKTAGSSSSAEMWVDRDPCAACGQNGGLRSLARNLGVDKLIVNSPSGTQIYTPTK